MKIGHIYFLVAIAGYFFNTLYASLALGFDSSMVDSIKISMVYCFGDRCFVGIGGKGYLSVC